MIEKYREMLWEAAETVLGYFGFYRTLFGDTSRIKNRSIDDYLEWRMDERGVVKWPPFESLGGDWSWFYLVRKAYGHSNEDAGLKTPVLDYDHILNLEHKFKTWLIRSTRMKFNIWIKEILFITRFPYLCYYHESFQLLRSLCLWLCCYTESRARWQDIVRRALDAVINIRRTPSNWEKSARTLCRCASLPLIIDYTSYQRYSYGTQRFF